jgi:hypothetical protein
LTTVVLAWFVLSFVFAPYLNQNDEQNRSITKTGNAIQIQSIARNAEGLLTIYVQNVGASSVTLSHVYVDNVLDSKAIPSGIPLSKGETATIDLTHPNTNPQITVRVVAEDGTFIEYTKTFVG